MLLLRLSTFYMETFLLCNLGITIYPIENLFIIFSVLLIYINALNIQDQCWQLFTPNNANNGITSQYFQLSFIVLFILFSEFFIYCLQKPMVIITYLTTLFGKFIYIKRLLKFSSYSILFILTFSLSGACGISSLEY